MTVRQEVVENDSHLAAPNFSIIETLAQAEPMNGHMQFSCQVCLSN